MQYYSSKNSIQITSVLSQIFIFPKECIVNNLKLLAIIVYIIVKMILTLLIFHKTISILKLDIV